MAKRAIFAIILAASLFIAGCERLGDDAEFAAPKRITPSQAAEMMLGYDVIVIDVRTEGEFYAERIPYAINIPASRIASQILEEIHDFNQIILIYCQSGRRSANAAQMLAEMGFARIYDFGGINDWPGARIPN